jgi:hypothetical protein
MLKTEPQKKSKKIRALYFLFLFVIFILFSYLYKGELLMFYVWCWINLFFLWLVGSTVPLQSIPQGIIECSSLKELPDCIFNIRHTHNIQGPIFITLDVDETLGHAVVVLPPQPSSHQQLQELVALPSPERVREDAPIWESIEQNNPDIVQQIPEDMRKGGTVNWESVFNCYDSILHKRKADKTLHSGFFLFKGGKEAVSCLKENQCTVSLLSGRHLEGGRADPGKEIALDFLDIHRKNWLYNSVNWRNDPSWDNTEAEQKLLSFWLGEDTPQENKISLATEIKNPCSKTAHLLNTLRKQPVYSDAIVHVDNSKKHVLEPMACVLHGGRFPFFGVHIPDPTYENKQKQAPQEVKWFAHCYKKQRRDHI